MPPLPPCMLLGGKRGEDVCLNIKFVLSICPHTKSQSRCTGFPQLATNTGSNFQDQEHSLWSPCLQSHQVCGLTTLEKNYWLNVRSTVWLHYSYPEEMHGHQPSATRNRVCWYFLQKNGSNIVSGSRRRSDVEGKGPVVLCVYIIGQADNCVR